MMRSLYSGVSGLKTHQVKMDVIGNNISNVNTVAYKSSSVTFGELMYQTTQNASGPNALTGTGGINARQIGLGVQSGAINTSIATAGAAQTTGNPFDIRIKGDSFFVVNSGTQNYFTRAGAFYVDGGGNLAMTSNGYNVMGWGVDDKTMEIKKGTVQPLRIMAPSNMTYPPEATSKGYVTGIIDKQDPDVSSTDGKIMNMKIYDNLGYEYSAKLAIRQVNGEKGDYSVQLVDVTDTDNKSVLDKFPGLKLGDWVTNTKEKTATSDGVTFPDTTHYQIGAEPAKLISDLKGADGKWTEDLAKVAKSFGYNKPQEFLDSYVGGSVPVYNADGTIQTAAVKGVTIESLLTAGNLGANFAIDAATKKATIKVTGFTGSSLKYDQGSEKGAFVGINGQPGKTSLTLSLGKYKNFSDVTIDFKTSTNVANGKNSTINANPGDTDGIGMGRKLGKLIGVSIANNGRISASYSNGQTKLLGQIAVAEFANASGLEKQGENLYSATLNSGEFDGIGTDITANDGAMTTGSLEMSNVDLSGEFTEMITTQRGFQANSRIITVSDTMLEELVNLKR
ncbi:MAG: flagellar hook-basal body complex protein [Lachnospiraceae bacterium]